MGIDQIEAHTHPPLVLGRVAVELECKVVIDGTLAGRGLSDSGRASRRVLVTQHRCCLARWQVALRSVCFLLGRRAGDRQQGHAQRREGRAPARQVSKADTVHAFHLFGPEQLWSERPRAGPAPRVLPAALRIGASALPALVANIRLRSPVLPTAGASCATPGATPSIQRIPKSGVAVTHNRSRQNGKRPSWVCVLDSRQQLPASSFDKKADDVA